MAEIKNPVTRKITIPAIGTVRTRLPSDEEVDAIVSEGCSTGRVRCDNDFAAIRPLIRFITYTGCRLGESLHMEWDDIDDGVRHIRRKPNCPTAHGMGWDPKWGKARSVHLFPEALKVFEIQPMTSRWGFPKPDGSRPDSLMGSWERLKGLHEIEDLMVKDLRTWMSYILKNRFGFTTKEVAAYLGHSPQVNERHYDPISLELIMKKMGGRSVTATQLLPMHENFTGPRMFGLELS